MRQVHPKHVIFICQLSNERVRLQKLLSKNFSRVCKLLQLLFLPRARQLRRLSVSPQPILPLRVGFFQNVTHLWRHKIRHKIVQIERTETIIIAIVHIVAIILAHRWTILPSRGCRFHQSVDAPPEAFCARARSVVLFTFRILLSQRSSHLHVFFFFFFFLIIIIIIIIIF